MLLVNIFHLLENKGEPGAGGGGRVGWMGCGGRGRVFQAAGRAYTKAQRYEETGMVLKTAGNSSLPKAKLQL